MKVFNYFYNNFLFLKNNINFEKKEITNNSNLNKKCSIFEKIINKISSKKLYKKNRKFKEFDFCLENNIITRKRKLIFYDNVNFNYNTNFNKIPKEKNFTINYINRLKENFSILEKSLNKFSINLNKINIKNKDTDNKFNTTINLNENDLGIYKIKISLKNDKSLNIEFYYLKNLEKTIEKNINLINYIMENKNISNCKLFIINNLKNIKMNFSQEKNIRIKLNQNYENLHHLLPISNKFKIFINKKSYAIV